MEKSYAFAAKQVALWAGLICFAILMMMIYPILQTPKLGEMPFICGNAFLPITLNLKTYGLHNLNRTS